MTDDLEVLNRLVDYHDHIAPPMVPVADDVRRGRRRVRRNRGIVTGAIAAGVAGVVLTSSLITGGDRHAGPAPAVNSPTPSPTPAKSQSPQTWVDTTVGAADGYGWDVPDPLDTARKAWFELAADHLDPQGGHLEPSDGLAWGGEFTRQPVEGSIYSTSGRVGLIVDRSALDPFDGCRYLRKGPDPSNGTVSCSAERIAGPAGERARISRYQRLCGSWDPGREGDDARPGSGSTYATCGDFRVAVAVERRDGLIGYVVVDGRGTPDFNPFTPAAMAAVAADPRLTLPESAFAVPSDRTVESVLVDHFQDYRAGSQTLSRRSTRGTGRREGAWDASDSACRCGPPEDLRRAGAAGSPSASSVGCSARTTRPRCSSVPGTRRTGRTVARRTPGPPVACSCTSGPGTPWSYRRASW